MKFELKAVKEIPDFCQKTRERDAQAVFHTEEEFPGVEMRLVDWPTCLGETEVAIYRPKGSKQALPALLYLHGGGWTTCNLKFLDDICRLIVQNTGFCVVSPEFHRAPENPFPGLFYECYDVARYLYDHSKELAVIQDQIAVGGDSAGGNLAAAICIKTVEDGLALFRSHMLYYPATDLTRTAVDRRSPDPNPRDDPRFMAWAVEAYAGSHDRRDPLISPLFLTPETAKKMPPLLLVTSYLDGLCEEGEEYALKLQKNGVEVTMRRQINGTHGTLNRKNWGYEETMALTYRYLKSIFM